MILSTLPALCRPKLPNSVPRPAFQVLGLQIPHLVEFDFLLRPPDRATVIPP